MDLDITERYKMRLLFICLRFIPRAETVEHIHRTKEQACQWSLRDSYKHSGSLLTCALRGFRSPRWVEFL